MVMNKFISKLKTPEVKAHYITDYMMIMKVLVVMLTLFPPLSF